MEGEEATRAFGNLDTEERLATLSELGTFRDEAKTPEVHVRTADDGDESMPGTDEVVLHDMGFEAGECYGSSRLRDRPCFCDMFRKRLAQRQLQLLTLKDVLDGRADLIVVDLDDAVEQLAAYPERFLAYDLDCRTVAERTDLVQRNTFASSKTPCHGVSIDSFDAKDARSWRADPLDVFCHAAYESASANRTEDRVNVKLAWCPRLSRGKLAQNFETNSTLAGDDEWVVVRWDEDKSVRLRETCTLGFGLVEILAMEHDLSSEPLYISNLDARCAGGHYDGARNLELSTGKRHTLGMVACEAWSAY